MRKKMMKKAISVILAASMILSMAACGKGGSGSGSSAEKNTKVGSYTPEYPIVDEEITITGMVMTENADDSVREDRIVWNEVMNVSGINIEWVFIDREAVSTYLASNDWPDFFLTTFSNSVVNDYGIAGGKFVNLLDYIGWMPNLAKTFEDYPEAKKAATEINGEMYSFPGISAGVTAVYAKPFYRTDLAEKAGYTKTPETVEDFRDMLRAVKNYTGEAPFIPRLNQALNYWMLPLYCAFGTSTDMTFDIGTDGKLSYSRTSEQMKHFYEYMNSLYDEGLIHKEVATMETSQIKELELSGNVCVLETSATLLSNEYFEDGQIHLAALAPLTSEYDSTQTYPDRSPVIFQSGPYLNADSEYIVEMCKMFDIMYATEEVVEGTGLYGMSFTYGMEGLDWDYEGDSYVFHTPTAYGDSNNTYIYAEMIWNNAGRCDGFDDMVVQGTGNNAVRQQQYAENVLPYETDPYLWGFMKFTEEEQDILDNKYTDIKNYAFEMCAKFITGVEDIDKGWDDYCATIEKMGIDEVLEVYQAAYDRWCEE